MTTKLCGCGCGEPQDRPGQRYRRACHTAYMRGWRAQQPKLPKSLRERYDEARERLRLEVQAFFGEGYERRQRPRED